LLLRVKKTFSVFYSFKLWTERKPPIDLCTYKLDTYEESNQKQAKPVVNQNKKLNYKNKCRVLQSHINTKKKYKPNRKM